MTEPVAVIVRQNTALKTKNHSAATLTWKMSPLHTQNGKVIFMQTTLFAHAASRDTLRAFQSIDPAKLKTAVHIRNYGASELMLATLTGRYPPPHDILDAEVERRT